MTTDLAIPDNETFQRFLSAADEGALDIDPDQVSIDIIARILEATSVDDVLGGGSLTHAREFLNVPFTLTNVRFNKSQYDGEGPAFYAVLEGADPQGEKVLVSCGARNVIAQAWKLRDMDALPVQVQLAEAERPTAAGYKVMWLEKAPRPF